MISVLLLLLGASIESYAVPAYPGNIKIIQKDGTPLTIRVYGDEFFGYTTTEDGYSIHDVDGIYYYSDILFDGSRSIVKIKANNPNKRTAEEKKLLANRQKASSNMYLGGVASLKRAEIMEEQAMSPKSGFPLKGEVKSVIILANFKDLAFKVPNANAEFTEMLNSPNYSKNNGVGSARDYFLDNSMGEFKPEFVVYGPVTLPESMEYYGAPGSGGRTDIRPTLMITDACKAAEDAGNDFSQFDFDGDGILDNVFVFYAGHNEAEGGGVNTIWPHKHVINSGATAGGKTIKTYSCTSEFRNATGTDMAGIGTFTHEFGHVLGLADIYDTNQAVDGFSNGLGNYNVMTGGNYNNEGKTPPYYNAFERYQLGWLKPEKIDQNRTYTVKNISENEAYIIPTSVTDEYLMVEFRNGQLNAERNWDKFIGDPSSSFSNKGIFITHIDKSNNDAAGMSAKSRWAVNGPNANSAHECARFIFSGMAAGSPAGGILNSPSEMVNYTRIPFPGEMKATQFNSKTSPAVAVDWNGKSIKIGIEQILINDNSATFVNYVGPVRLTAGSNNILVELLVSVFNPSIKWKESTATEYEIIENYKGEALRISNIKPNVEYDIVIEASNEEGGEIEVLRTHKIKTNPINAEIGFPTVVFDHFQDKKHSYFIPSINNYGGSLEDIKWTLNGEVKTIDYTTLLERGNYSLVCEVMIDGKPSKIYKNFKVK